LDGDFSGWFEDGDLENFDTAHFWIGTRCYGEGVFGSVGVVFFVGYLVCSDSWGCGVVLDRSNRKEQIRRLLITLILCIYFCKFGI